MLAKPLQEGPEEVCGSFPSAEIVSLFKIIIGALLLHSLPSLTSWPLLRVTQRSEFRPQAVAVITHVIFTCRGPTWPFPFNRELKTPGHITIFEDLKLM